MSFLKQKIFCKVLHLTLFKENFYPIFQEKCQLKVIEFSFRNVSKKSFDSVNFCITKRLFKFDFVILLNLSIIIVLYSLFFSSDELLSGRSHSRILPIAIVFYALIILFVILLIVILVVIGLHIFENKKATSLWSPLALHMGYFFRFFVFKRQMFPNLLLRRISKTRLSVYFCNTLYFIFQFKQILVWFIFSDWGFWNQFYN